MAPSRSVFSRNAAAFSRNGVERIPKAPSSQGQRARVGVRKNMPILVQNALQRANVGPSSLQAFAFLRARRRSLPVRLHEPRKLGFTGGRLRCLACARAARPSNAGRRPHKSPMAAAGSQHSDWGLRVGGKPGREALVPAKARCTGSGRAEPGPAGVAHLAGLQGWRRGAVPAATSVDEKGDHGCRRFGPRELPFALSRHRPRCSASAPPPPPMHCRGRPARARGLAQAPAWLCEVGQRASSRCRPRAPCRSGPRRRHAPS